MDEGEECDDNNTVSGDMCSSVCKVEIMSEALPVQPVQTSVKVGAFVIAFLMLCFITGACVFFCIIQVINLLNS